MLFSQYTLFHMHVLIRTSKSIRVHEQPFSANDSTARVHTGQTPYFEATGTFWTDPRFLGCRKWRPEAAKTLETANGKSRAISDERVSSASRVMLVKVVDWSLDSILQTTI